MDLNIKLIAYLIFINILAFILYGVDKKRAIKRKSRIPESVLLWMARLGGGIGCLLGMFVFHHKKRYPKFRINIPLWITIWTIALVLFLTLWNGNFSEEMENSFKNLFQFRFKNEI